MLFTYNDIKEHFLRSIERVLKNQISYFDLIKHDNHIISDVFTLRWDFIGDGGRIWILNQQFLEPEPDETQSMVRRINYLILLHYLFNTFHLNVIKQYINEKKSLDDLFKLIPIDDNYFVTYGGRLSSTYLELYSFADNEKPSVNASNNKVSSTKNNPDSFESIAQSQIDLYKKKNSDYGSATDKLFQKHGFKYYQIMLEQKMQRIDSLVKKDNQHNFESLEDTLLDLSNYAILAVESLRKHKQDSDSTS